MVIKTFTKPKDDFSSNVSVASCPITYSLVDTNNNPLPNGHWMTIDGNGYISFDETGYTGGSFDVKVKAQTTNVGSVYKTVNVVDRCASQTVTPPTDDYELSGIRNGFSNGVAAALH